MWFETFHHKNEFTEKEPAAYSKLNPEKGKSWNDSNAVPSYGYDNTNSQRWEFIADTIADQKTASAMMSYINNPDSPWPPIIEMPNSIWINDTSSSMAKSDFWWTEWGKGNEVGTMNA